MLIRAKTLITNPALSGTFIVAVGIFVGSVFSYLLQIGLGHLLSIEEFGTFNAFLSLSVLFSIPAGAAATSLIKQVAELLAHKAFDTLTEFFWSLVKLSLVLGTVLALFFLLLNTQVSAYLNITHTSLIFVFAAFLAFSFLNVIPQSYLQGLLRFKAFALLSILSQFLRLSVPLGLVYVGLGIPGAYAGLTLAALISFALALALLNKNFTAGQGQDLKLGALYIELLRFSVPVLLISSGIAVLNNADIIMVKHFFTPYDAGIYAGVVTMSKVFLFGASIVQVVMFPQIAHLHACNGNVTQRFGKFLALQLVFILGGLACFAVFPQVINSVMFGGKFAESVTYLPLFSVFVALYVMITFLAMFLLAVNKTRSFLIILPACMLQYALITVAHADITSVIRVNILAAALACLSIAGYVMRVVSRSALTERSAKIPV
jgi:O-antigen/teichoic acid export membrane protein